MTDSRKLRNELPGRTLIINRSAADDISSLHVEVIQTLEGKELDFEELFKEGDFEDQVALENVLSTLVSMQVLEKEDEKYSIKYSNIVIPLHLELS